MAGLKDKRVLITGRAGAIGAATAARFLEEGSRVVVLDRDEAALERAEEIVLGMYSSYWLLARNREKS